MKKGIGDGKRVYVGMSGGVDSSVSAALLKKEGYDVVGVFIKVWQPEWLRDSSICTWREDRIDAMRVAAKLDIPFITLDLEKEYKKEVVDYMIQEYKEGRTPNPDVMCNSFVKFGGFYNWAMKEDGDFVATGHYAQNIEGKLVIGNDPNKDQSYFLWTLRKEQMNHILFPVGNLEKPEVRKLAKKFDLPVADKKDSQGLCFIGKIDIKEFLEHYIPPLPGNVLDEKGNVVGTHDGAFYYTIGQRHGFTITEKTPEDKPMYIVEKNIENNTITITNKSEEGNLGKEKKKISLRNINWIQGVEPSIGEKFQARSRYREKLQNITFVSKDTVEFENPQSTLTSGQSLVIYKGTECCGGGIII